MKTKSIFLVMLLAVSMLFVGCKKESKGLTRVTYYPVITLEGDLVMVIEKGSEFVEPGFTCTMGEDDVTDKVTVSGEVNPNECGFYTLVYTSPNNSDGFGTSASRQVIVHESNPLEFTAFATDPKSYRVYGAGDPVEMGDAFEVNITYHLGDNVFVVDDMFGGWYAQRAGYGEKYAMQGIIQIKEDNSIELLDSHVDGWDDGLDYLEEGTWNEDAGQLHWKIGYAGAMYFDITLVKQ